jgi:hypothetical protein
VYEGKTPSDCTIDGFGNLYFVDTNLNSIFSIGYLDLWGGFKNQHYVLYRQSEGQSNIQNPIALDVYDSKEMYFINNQDCESIGLLNHVSAVPTSENEQHIDIEVREPLKGWGVAYTENDYVFYSQSNGDVWAIDTKEDKKKYVKSTDFFRDPRGLCYGDGKVYVADYEKGEVYFMHDNSKVNEKPREFVKIQGAYGLYCINYDHDYSGWIMMSLVALLLF